MISKPPPDLAETGEAAPLGAEESVAELKARIAALTARIEELTSERATGPTLDREEPAPLDKLMRHMMSDGKGAAAERSLRQSHYLLLSVIDNWPSYIFVKDVEGHYLLSNRYFAELWRLSRETIIGVTDADLFPAEIAASLRATDKEIMASGKAISVEETVPTLEGEKNTLVVKFPIYDESGSLAGICGIATDITPLKQSEAARAALQEQVIAAHRAALQELSTPLVPIADGVLAMPLVGAIDAARAAQILETLLDGISKQRAHTAILDITGVRVVDTQVASALVNAARAAKLLGARVLLTGLRPEVAQTLVGLGADLTGIVTLSTLKSGIAHALVR